MLSRYRLSLFGLALFCGSLLLCRSLSFAYSPKVVHGTVLGKAPTHAFAMLELSLMGLELLAVVEDFLVFACLCTSDILILLCSIGGRISLRTPHLLLVLLLLAFQLLLLLHEIGASVLVQIKVEGSPLVEVLIGLRNHRVTVVFYLLDLIKVLLQSLARMRRIVPSLGLFDDSRNRLVLYDNANVDGVVHLAEDAALVRVRHVDVLEQLEPEGL